MQAKYSLGHVVYHHPTDSPQRAIKARNSHVEHHQHFLLLARWVVIIRRNISEPFDLNNRVKCCDCQTEPLERKRIILQLVPTAIV